jgi:hypothetical protein
LAIETGTETDHRLLNPLNALEFQCHILHTEVNDFIARLKQWMTSSFTVYLKSHGELFGV